MDTPIAAAGQVKLSKKALDLKRSTCAKEEPQRRGYRVIEFCQAFGISRSQAYIEIAEGRLKIRKVGRRTLIAAEDAEEWLSACAVETRAA